MNILKIPEGDTWNVQLIKTCDIDYTIERGLITYYIFI